LNYQAVPKLPSSKGGLKGRYEYNVGGSEEEKMVV
jgi:hypothetical protein